MAGLQEPIALPRLSKPLPAPNSDRGIDFLAKVATGFPVWLRCAPCKRTRQQARLDWDNFGSLRGQIAGPEAFADMVRLLIRGFDQNPMLHT